MSKDRRYIAHTAKMLGKRFGRLIVLKIAPTKIRHRKWLCKCDCGNKTIVYNSGLTTGRIMSCGCLHLELLRHPTSHGETLGKIKTLEYRTWNKMKERCNNPNIKSYCNYGGRGIKICERWLNNYENFLEDMGRKPTKNHSIDRIDNEKGYYKENCKWSTAKEQANNRRKPRKHIKKKRTTKIKLNKPFILF